MATNFRSDTPSTVFVKVYGVIPIEFLTLQFPRISEAFHLANNITNLRSLICDNGLTNNQISDTTGIKTVIFTRCQNGKGGGEGSRLKCKDAWHKLYVAYLPTSVFWLRRSIELVCCRHNQCSCRSTFFRNFLRDVWNRPHNNISWSWKSSKHG